MNNLGQTYFINKKRNVDFVVKMVSGDFNKLVEGYSASGGPSTSFLMRKTGSVCLTK